MMAVLAAANLIAWLCAWTLFGDRPVLLGAAALAYGLGLRHAVDADHIAAIDNATRKMMEVGRRPVALGLFFSLGHSTVVLGLTIGVLAAAATFASLLEPVRAYVSVVGAGLSSLFLVVVAAANLMTFVTLARRLLRDGNAATRSSTSPDPHAGGVMTRLLGPVSSCVTRSWHMLIVGFVFGLSFETASEVSLLGLSVSEMTRGLSAWTILVFPALFTAGMSLLDAADGVLMVGVYGWALSRPDRRLVYNIVITGLSVSVALLVAGIGLAGMIAGHDEATRKLAFADACRHRHEHVGLRCGVRLLRGVAGCRRHRPAARSHRRSAWIKPSAPKMTRNDTPVVTVPSA